MDVSLRGHEGLKAICALPDAKRVEGNASLADMKSVEASEAGFPLSRE